MQRTGSYLVIRFLPRLGAAAIFLSAVFVFRRGFAFAVDFERLVVLGVFRLALSGAGGFLADFSSGTST